MTGLIVKQTTQLVTGRIPQPLILGIVALTFVVSGCQKTTSKSAATSTGGPPTTFADNISAPQIFSAMVSQYRNAASYSDRAVLYMSYRLNGRAIQEPQPWAVAIDEQGRFAADLFNSQIRCDGKLFSCYVYDIESGNLDNQRLLLPVKGELPIAGLYNDKIANHFIAGYSEMPLEENKNSDQPQLVPPTIGLLTGLVEPAWLRPDARIERYEDSEIDGRPCFVLRCWQTGADGDFVDLWIDKENSTIWQAALPVDCLADKVRTSPEIENLRIVARFHEASFDQPIADSTFALKPRSDATPVSQFVKIPEPLNSEMIGMKTPDFEFQTQSGTRVFRDDFSGRPTALLWIGGDPDEAIVKLDQLKSSLPAESAHFGVIYSDRDLADPEIKSNAMNMHLNKIARATNVPFYFDKELNTSMQFQIKSVPCVAVLDKDSTIQFATALDDDDWPVAVKAAIERVAKGEDVGNEMLNDYQQFLEAYHQQLLAVSAAGLMNGQAEFDSAGANPRTAGRLTWNRTWTNSQFKLPGNIAVAEVGEIQRMFVFDGWRSVVELNFEGQVVARHELDLPENAGVSALRVAQDKNGQTTFAAFMPKGKAVYVFDERFNRKTTYRDNAGAGIRDAQLNGKGQLAAVAFDGGSGWHAFDTKTGEGDKVNDSNVSSISPDGAFMISNGSLVSSTDGSKNTDLASWQLSRMKVTGTGKRCYLATAKDGSWSVLGSVHANSQWTASIGPQAFENLIEPIAATAGQKPYWAIANSNGGVHVFNHDGSWLGDFKSNSELLGIALVETDSQLRLIISTKLGVTNWNLGIAQNGARSALNARR